MRRVRLFKDRTETQLRKGFFVGLRGSVSMSESHKKYGTVPTFPLATHASIIRAHEKDEGYSQDVYSKCYEVVRRFLGPHRALLWRKEIKLLSDMLYYQQTVGSGVSTLGEEYCSLMRVDGQTNGPLGFSRNHLLAFLQALQPYWSENYRKIVSRLSRDGASGVAREAADAQLMHMYHATNGGLRQENGDGSSPQQGGVKQSRIFLQWSRFVSKVVKPCLEKLQESTSSGLEWFLRLDIVGKRVMPWAVWALEHQGDLARFHLALFYIFGIYYNVPMRMLGVKYLRFGQDARKEPLQLRVLYRILGTLLMVQATVSLFATNRNRNDGYTSNKNDKTSETSSGIEFRDYVGKIIDFSSLGKHQSPAVKGAQKCPLCLSERKVPTSTPCGHVFCWYCIGEWCSKKPECPLCRSMATPSQLVPVIHADF